MMPRFSVIGGDVVHRIIHADMARCMEVVRAAYVSHSRRETVNPDSYFLRFPDRPADRIIALPAHLGGDGPLSGIKWIASYPGNTAKGIPRASAVLILNDGDNGYPFACLEASVISAARTAASAALAASAMRSGTKHARRLGIIGNGLIARYIYTFLIADGWTFDEVALHDASMAESRRFSERLHLEKNHRTLLVATADELIEGSDLIVFATVAGAPHVHGPRLFDRHPAVLHISLRDLHPDIILASTNIVDDIDHALKADTSLHLAEKATGGRDFIAGTIVDLLAGRIDLPADRPVIFSPFGLGVLDLAVGRWVYETAQEAGDMVEVDGFFHDMVR